MAEKLLVVCPYCNTTNRVPKDRLRDGGKCGHCHRTLFDGTPVTLDDPVRFAKQVDVSDIPILADFSADWCAPCHALAPIFQEAAAALEPDVRLVKVDVDKVPALGPRYAIRGVPTLILFLHGRELHRVSGLMPLHQLISWTRQHLQPKPAETAAADS
jgi:thioredoxin 2